MDEPSQPMRPTRPTRRTVLRAGGAAAWSVPVVAVVSAAPAGAADPSGGADLVLTSQSIVAIGDDPNRFDYRGTMRNDGLDPVSVGRLSVTMNITPGRYGYGGTTPEPAVATDGRWVYVPQTSSDGSSYVTQMWNLGGPIVPEETVDLPPIRYQATSPQYNGTSYSGTFSVMFETDQATVQNPPDTPFRSRPEDEENGALTLATNAVADHPPSNPNRVVHTGTLTNAGPGVGGGTLVIRATLDGDATWSSGGVAPDPPVSTPHPGAWVNDAGGGIGSSTIQQGFFLQTPVPTGQVINLPPVQYVADRATFTGTVTTEFTPNSGTSVNSPEVVTFASSPPPGEPVTPDA